MSFSDLSLFLSKSSLTQLQAEHGVCHRFSADGRKVSLNYDQILVKNGDSIAEVCRGLVIEPNKLMTSPDDVVGSFLVLARPMDRFYNYGDQAAAEFDWSNQANIKVYEKLDGTMIVMYFDHKLDVWCVATRGVPEADQPLPDSLQLASEKSLTFAKLFWKAASETTGNVKKFLDSLDKKNTYTFELTTPINRVVVAYNDYRITLIAVRNTQTGEEFDVANVDISNIPIPRSWNIFDPRAIAAFVEATSPSELEGIVAVDTSSSVFKRLKIKSKAWVLSSKAKSLVTCSKRAAVESIATGTIDDILSIIDQQTSDQLRSMIDKYRAYVKNVDSNFLKYKTIANSDKKTFALAIKDLNEWSAPYFALWDNRAQSCYEWIKWSFENNRIAIGSIDYLVSKVTQE